MSEDTATLAPAAAPARPAWWRYLLAAGAALALLLLGAAAGVLIGLPGSSSTQAVVPDDFRKALR